MRRTAVVVACLVTAAALQPVTAGQALAPAERAARISLSAPSTAAPHSTITLRGRTKARRGTKVKIFQRPVHRSSWHLEGTTRIKKRGKFRYSEGVTDFSRYYRACVRRSCSAARLVTVAKPTPPKPQPATLTLTGGPSAQIEAGQSITASGTASANLIGKFVALQAYDATSETWGAIGGAAVDGAGNWSVSGPVGTAGKAIGVRVIAPATATTQEAYVGAGVITVYGWVPVMDLAWVEGDGGWRWGSGSFTVNGTAYEKSVGARTYYSGTRTNQVNLARACKSFAAVVGLSDETGSTVRTTAVVSADAVERSRLSNISLGQATPVTIDVTNALRLKLDVTTTSGSGDGYTVFGNARVLCAF